MHIAQSHEISTVETASAYSGKPGLLLPEALSMCPVWHVSIYEYMFETLVNEDRAADLPANTTATIASTRLT